MEIPLLTNTFNLSNVLDSAKCSSPLTSGTVRDIVEVQSGLALSRTSGMIFCGCHEQQRLSPQRWFWINWSNMCKKKIQNKIEISIPVTLYSWKVLFFNDILFMLNLINKSKTLDEGKLVGYCWFYRLFLEVLNYCISIVFFSLFSFCFKNM